MEQFKEKQYETIYTDEKAIKRYCHLDAISMYKDIPESVDLYRTYFEKTMKENQMHVFDHLVKVRWLRNRFCYGGKRRDPNRPNGQYIEAAWGIFIRHYVGYDSKLFFSWSYGVFQKLLAYIDEIIPDIDERNPFKEKIEYPYTYIQMEHMMLVYQMDERMDLLRHAEKHKMRYTTFYDYVMNYTQTYNEKEYRYELVYGGNRFQPYIKDMVKAVKRYGGRKLRMTKAIKEQIRRREQMMKMALKKKI